MRAIVKISLERFKELELKEKAHERVCDMLIDATMELERLKKPAKKWWMFWRKNAKLSLLTQKTLSK